MKKKEAAMITTAGFTTVPEPCWLAPVAAVGTVCVVTEDCVTGATVSGAVTGDCVEVLCGTSATVVVGVEAKIDSK